MELHLTGMGVHPRIDVSLGSGENISLDMGHAMARDVVSKAFTLINSSPLKVRYKLNMESQLPKKCPAKSFSELTMHERGRKYCHDSHVVME